MSIGVNNCVFLGLLGRDPEVRYMSDGAATATLSLAVDRTWKDKDGQKKSACEWVRLALYGQQAEFCGQYAKKGSQVYAEGRMQTRKYTDKQGQERQTTEIIVKNFQLLGGKPKIDSKPEQYQPLQKSQPQQVREAYTGAGHYNEEDCPF